MKKVSIIIPAFNEADYIVPTLRAVRRNIRCDEIIVVDDGSTDGTADLARVWADNLIKLPVNRGKGYALQKGWEQSTGDILLFLDADLRETAGHGARLLEPIEAGDCDMAIAILPGPKKKAGLGLAKGLARKGICLLTGFAPTAPLSGQRAIRRDVLEKVGRLDHGFGIEVGLTVDVLRAGYQVAEVPVAFTHRETGNDLRGYLHRGKEFIAIGRALGKKWRESVRMP